MIDPDEAGLLSLAHISPEELRRNHQLVRETGNRLGGPPAVITWFLPQVDHALKGGVRTVFMIAQRMSQDFGTANQFVIIGYGNSYPATDSLAGSLRRHFPELKFTIQPFRTRLDDPALLPAADCGVCTLWTTAYVCARYQRVRAKFYLVQDFEPRFYPAGSVSAVIEQTYRFGFALIANTRGVAAPLGKYTRDVTQFCPGVDRTMFSPEQAKSAPGEPFRIVFYGRPQNVRNCFSLGIQILKEVKRALGARVEIVSVGAEWDEAEAGVEGLVKNLGLLPTMEEVADLYRRSDLGLVFMMTPHPSYQPLEYMASGCVVATNINESTSWLLNDTNSLRLTPIPGIAASQICDLVMNRELWANKRQSALRDIQDIEWSDAMGTLTARICQ